VTDNPWKHFEEAIKNRKTLPPIEIGGEQIQLPADPSVLFVMKLNEAVMEHGDDIPVDVALHLIELALGDESTAHRVMARLSVEEVQTVFMTLLREWGLARPHEAPPPPPIAAEAG
jgi:hypothetical protein